MIWNPSEYGAASQLELNESLITEYIDVLYWKLNVPSNLFLHRDHMLADKVGERFLCNENFRTKYKFGQNNNHNETALKK